MSSQSLPSVSRLKSLKGKRVLMRVDFNVPMGPKGIIGFQDDDRIRAATPTIERLAAHGAKVVLISHLGQPPARDPKYSLAPVARHLGQLMDVKVRFIPDDILDDEKVDKKIRALEEGEIAMLENIRFYKGEEKNDPFFSRRLASIGDIFVNEAFGTAHRSHASTVGIAKYLPSYAGYLMENEVKSLEKVLAATARPLAVLMGGAKISTKLPTLEKFSRLADVIMLGGAMANNFFKALGWEVGDSLVSREEVKLAKKFLGRRKIRLPVDVLVASAMRPSAEVRVCAPDEVRKHEIIVDIGPATIREYAEEIKRARIIVWNGPLGAFEIKKFSHGSIALGRLVATRSRGQAYGVVGGGETLQCLQATGMAEYVDHVSTGGGAMLDLLAGKKLPAVEALKKNALMKFTKR